MKLLGNIEMSLVGSGNCPNCGIDYLEAYSTEKNRNYIICMICGYVYKIIRRKMKHSEDYKFFEHVSWDSGYADRGYYISEKTFKKNRIKLQIEKMYSGHNFFELDDLWIKY